MAKLIFCEGDLDLRVLQKIKSGMTDVVLDKGPGKKGMKAFMQGYLMHYKGVMSPSLVVGFRDRDFDFPVPTHLHLIIPKDDKGKIIATNRTAIENYLLDPLVFFKFIQEKNIRISRINNVEAVKQLFDSAASEIVFYSAARHALGALRKGIGLNTTWTNGSGHLPSYFDKRHCLQQATSVVKRYMLESRDISSKKMRLYFYDFKNVFDEKFITRGDYLKWFDGKDLEKVISRKLGGFSFKAYHDYAVNQFDFNKFPDLVQLHEILKGSKSIEEIIATTPD